ncbi:UNVERIFIED_ORG: hypothetical protein L601_001500000200 [Gordonia westfalica J30]
MANKTTTSTVAPEYESLQDAAARTGFSIFTLRDKINRGELPAYRMTNKPKARVRVRVADVDALFVPVIPTEVYER